MEDGAADFASPPCQRGVELAEGLRRGDSSARLKKTLRELSKAQKETADKIKAYCEGGEEA